MKINISAHIDVQPHKVSRPTDLPTISESKVVEFCGRTRAATRRMWMVHARMTGDVSIYNVNTIEAQSKHIKLSTGLNMLRMLNLRGSH